ncbi:aminotransferase class I/II-fold pyridoxal phosphate-dependent enzyme [Rhodoblastus acidophilus]|uniref:Aminotransferase class I/II-fold pyridoxal phosphate-dependent enzyme n=1 Tax=Candidatus Rhodoblastus alkanivorans TaxID=2954117 RepID=A0ABS9Z320_9HYPH|nr:aminotransferase class I/II-fold pyridoxal phosphate-dependent enzyme [Candidatus Rhodoblastus alkanivorans]MCI4677502.1 aminotransferase class I/II-fold pyridoxal phosphate-dependent enzyme [Candidatus Rhodoblastus alkanivorans]MCI4681861.1 aminotransferase class I/II-fold pyridoxal phosphate-dependent enzyme [Candidatus Rhodoblastus alkanivorans]MDI4642911.1 aminotransferase class I/II-fold pyridoxal phosphate-dependent enzyme [Rhodoblastus acidophilus]
MPAAGFDRLPGSEEQRFLREIFLKAGLSSPYFLLHEGDAGARSVVDGREVLNFSSYDYLGLNHHPAVRAAACAAVGQYGVSASASRLVAGERPIHRQLEAALARHYGHDSCLTFVSGYGANVSALTALLGPRDLILHDALAHNSIVMGGEFCRAERRAFPHNDLAALDALLADLRPRRQRVLIVAEGLYSMDGDLCDLPGLVEIKERHGAWLMIDDAHGLGVLGDNGGGVFEHFGVDPRRVDIWMGTMSKALASCGGYIAGCTALIEHLKHSAGGFVYSVGLAPPLAAAALAALEILEASPDRVAKLRANSLAFAEAARAAGLDTGLSAGAAVVPAMVGNSLVAARLSQQLLERRINVQPIIHPAVPEGEARLRFFLSSEHEAGAVAEAAAIVAEELAALRADGEPAQ